jgi:DNA-binding response OmpR family regulator
MGELINKKVIYIEDDPDMIDLVTLILRPRGINVKGAHGGRQGLDMVREELPDLILLDLMMPDLDGSRTSNFCDSGHHHHGQGAGYRPGSRTAYC